MKLVSRIFPVGIAFTMVAVVANAAMVDISRPGDPIALVNGTDDGDGSAGPPPAGEVELHAIDDVGQKYLNFLDRDSGFAVTPSANPTNLPVTGVRFYTANDAVPRDPANFVLAGSNGTLEAGPWTNIFTGNLELPEGRNAGGDAVVIPPTGNLDAFNQTVTFENAATYSHYRVTFPLVKDEAAANSMQIAEVELLVVPEPASATLAGLALLGLGALARRRR